MQLSLAKEKQVRLKQRREVVWSSHGSLTQLRFQQKRLRFSCYGRWLYSAWDRWIAAHCNPQPIPSYKQLHTNTMCWQRFITSHISLTTLVPPSTLIVYFLHRTTHGLFTPCSIWSRSTKPGWFLDMEWAFIPPWTSHPSYTSKPGACWNTCRTDRKQMESRRW